MMNFDLHLQRERNAPLIKHQTASELVTTVQREYRRPVYRAPARATRNWAWRPERKRGAK